MMSDGLPKRRRWLILLLVIGVLVVSAPLAWRYRPMSEMERRLLGTWRAGGDPERGRITLTRGRRISLIVDETTFSGSWHASDQKLYLSYDQPFPRTWNEVPGYLKQRISREREPEVGPVDVEFEGTTRVHWRYRMPGAGEQTEELLERDL